jgi:UDP-N-acetylmuramoyl-tripeptide--D-alanyl-D-alanine ligase
VKLAARELASWCGGDLSGDDAVLRGVSIDTRTIRSGELFVAIAGERFDGHDYLAEAVSRGARALLVSRADVGEPGVPLIRVSDTVAALGQLAHHLRERFTGPVVAITGSNGKTTTKELCADVLTAAGVRVRRSPGNLNNEIGLPLSVLRLEPEDDALVVELGMNHAGEVDRLAAIVQPDVGAITQVAPAHLGPLGSLDAIARAKGELLDHIDAEGTAVLNADDPRVMAQRARFKGRTLLFGLEAVADFRAERDPADPQAFRLTTPAGACEVRMLLPGAHLVQDALCAAACAWATGRLGPKPLDALHDGLEEFRGVPGRLTRHDTDGGLLVLDDSYNANPHSVRAALETLSAMRSGRRAIAVLADMLELGDEGPSLHAETGRAAACARVDVLIAVGPLSEHTARGAREAGVTDVIHTDDCEGAVRELSSLVRTGDAILVKGSRGMSMERAVRALLEEL